ncbi:MAG: DUF1003 domain-containing protein [Bacillota bacterium]
MGNAAPHRPATWFRKHRENLSMGQKIADGLANLMGSWPFIIAQTIIIICWVVFNLVAFMKHWDPYPFILLNLLFSTQAAYAAPIIMMSQNRQAERDRAQALADYETNQKAEQEIEDLQVSLARIEIEKLDRIIALLTERSK